MKHFSEKDWMQYINGQLHEERRKELEDHLFSCDQCLEIYMKGIENTDQIPVFEDSSFTNNVIERLPQKKKHTKTVYQHPLFHYGLAAVITFTLMTTGFFQSITGIIGTVEASSEQPVSASLMEKAIALIDILDVKDKEGK